MKLHECSSRAVLVAVVVAWLGSSAWPSGAHAMSFGGQSTGVQATVPAAGIVIKAASGQLPPSGGEVDASLLSGDIPGSATGGVSVGCELLLEFRRSRFIRGSGHLLV